MKAHIISFHCTLKDPMGRIISSSFNNDVLTETLGEKAAQQKQRAPRVPSLSGQSTFDEPLAGLIEGLQGVKKGEKRSIVVTADRAYGFYDPSLVMEMSRKKLPHGEALEVGYQVFTQSTEGETRIFRVIAVDTHTVTLDGNHPLAGQDLCFDIEATASREATKEEIAQARVISAEPVIH